MSLSTNSKLKLKQLLTESVQNEKEKNEEKKADLLKVSERLSKNVTTRVKINRQESTESTSSQKIYSSSQSLNNSAINNTNSASAKSNQIDTLKAQHQRQSKLSRHNLTSASFNCKSNTFSNNLI